MDSPNSYLGPPTPGLDEQLADVDEAIERTSIPGVQFQAGILEGGVYFFAYASPPDNEGRGVRGRYQWYRRDLGPLSLQLYKAALDVYGDLVRQHFTFDGHRPYAKVG